MSRAGLQQQAQAALQTSLLPGEELRTVSVVLAGPNPFLEGLAFMGPFFTEFYAGMTESRFLLVETSAWRRRGLEEFSAYLLEMSLIRSAQRAFYLSVWVAWPTDRTFRLNFDVGLWGSEARALIEALGG